METKDYTQEIIDIIRSNTSPAVMSSRLEDYHANDLAEVLKKLTVQERCKLYRILDKDMLSDILEYTEADEAAEYLKEMEPRKAAAILSGMETDSLAEVLRMLDKGKKRLLIDLLDDDVRHDIEVIASFDEDEIGSRMTTNCIIIQKNVTVKEAMSSLICQAAKNDNISTIFVVSSQQKFYGAIDLKDLIIARQDHPLEELVVTSYPYVYAEEEIDECIERLKDYSEDSVPVLDNDNRLLGVITSSSIIELVDDEMGEDYAKLAGLTAEEDLKEPLKESMKKRMPWLLILLALGMVVSSVVGMFETVVTQLPIIMCFQSLILDMAGNVDRFMQRWFVGTDVLCTDRTLYFCNQRKDPRLFLCGIRVHRCCPASGNADLQCGWYVYSTAFQKDQGRSGSCFRSFDYDHQRPCCGSVLLRLELAVFDRVLPYGGLILTED